MLTVNYTYADAEGDLEGGTGFRWLSNGVPVIGATSNTYTLRLEDEPGVITAEVTPMALAGSSVGASVPVSVAVGHLGPVVAGFARYEDFNTNGICDQGDLIIVPFDQDVTVAGTAMVDAFFLPVSGNQFGSGATLTGGPANHEVTITLGLNPELKTRLEFGSLGLNDPSGIDVATNIPAGSITGGPNSTDAAPGSPADIVPVLGASTDIPSSDEDGRSVAVADLDRDGDMDLVVANAGSDVNVVYGNNRDGTFSVFPLGTEDSHGVAIEDLDGDGRLDLIFANAGTAGNSVYQNASTGPGSFVFGAQPTLGAEDSRAVAIEDLDGDGRPDLVFANAGTAGNSVYENVSTGAGDFAFSMQAAQGAEDSRGVAIEDLDGDGMPDLVFANAGAASNSIYQNVSAGAGNFAFSSQTALGTADSRAVAIEDLDGDGRPDLVFANAGATGNSVYQNVGAQAGEFTFSAQAPLGAEDDRGVAIADLDGDGDLDLVFAVDGTGGYTVYMGDGGLGFIAYMGNSPGAGRAIVLVDVENDGDRDLILIRDSGSNRVSYCSLSGTWGAAVFRYSGQEFGAEDGWDVELGDLDGDGDLDCVVANQGQPNRVYMNVSGVLHDSGQSLGSSFSLASAMGDVDGDGDLDFAFGNDGQPNRIYLNDGAGWMIDTGQTLGSEFTYAVDLVDLDGDGDLDLVAANSGAQSNRVYINDGAGVFMDSGQSLGSSFSEALAVGDLDGDGDVDLAVGNYGNPNLIYMNDGLGNFAVTAQVFPSNQTRSMALGDVDQDGDLDLVAGNDGQANFVYLNDGVGGFVDSGQAINSGDCWSTTLGDIDGDGDLDLVVTNDNVANFVYLNDGAGVFADSGQTLGSDLFESNSTALGDLDGDGDLDIAVVNDDQQNRIYLNE